MTYRIITLSGEVGSGKSSIARTILDALPGWERANTGQRFRDFCASRGLTIEQVSELPPEVDREFDRSQQDLLRHGSRLVVEGRLAGWLGYQIEGVFRVYCCAPLEVRIQRYMERERRPYAEAQANIALRDEKDMLKFQKIYGVDDYRDPRYYHLVVDTSTALPDELARQVLESAGLQTSR